MIFMRAVPPELVEGVVSGIYKVTGSVVRDISTGRGVGFLQETGALQSTMNSLLSNGLSPVTGFANLALGVTGAIQNQQIKAGLVEIRSSLAILGNLQLGTLAVSGLGLGVSVAGFAVMLRRLKGISDHLGTLETKIDSITRDRRMDAISVTFADIRSQLDIVDSLAVRSNRVGSAEAAERDLFRSAGRLEEHFRLHAGQMERSPITPAQMDLLWSLAAAIRLCHEAGLRALFSIDEMEAARLRAETHAQRFLELGQALSPDSLARLCAASAANAEEAATARRAALPQAELLVFGLRDSVAAIGSQAELARTLISRQIPGSLYLETLANETEEPLLMLAA